MPKRTAAAKPQLSEVDLETYAGMTVAIGRYTGRILSSANSALTLHRQMANNYRPDDWRPFTVPKKGTK